MNIMNLSISVCGLSPNFPGYMTHRGNVHLSFQREWRKHAPFPQKSCHAVDVLFLFQSLSLSLSLPSPPYFFPFHFFYLFLPSLLTSAHERGSQSRGYQCPPLLQTSQLSPSRKGLTLYKGCCTLNVLLCIFILSYPTYS